MYLQSVGLEIECWARSKPYYSGSQADRCTEQHKQIFDSVGLPSMILEREYSGIFGNIREYSAAAGILV